MSKIGKKPIKIPENVTIKVNGQIVSVTGPKGVLTQKFRPEINIKHEGKKIIVERKNENPKAKALHGLTRSLLSNMIFGVNQGWSKGLELHGVGYRAKIEADTLVLSLGFSHPVKIKPPPGIHFEISANKIKVFGTDKQLVGQTAANIRKIRKPEPYKGKGIRYIGEIIRKKAGKAGKVGPGAGTGMTGK